VAQKLNFSRAAEALRQPMTATPISFPTPQPLCRPEAFSRCAKARSGSRARPSDSQTKSVSTLPLT